MTMAPEPLKSAMTTSVGQEDTSLAVPSDNKLRSGHQRVLDQVHTIKRGKSKKGTNGTLSPSPTSPSPKTLALNEFESFKFSPTKANGTFNRTNSAVSTNFNKSVNYQRSRTISSKTIGGRYVSNSATWENQVNSSTWPTSPNGLQPSQSDPALAPVFSAAPAPAPAMKARGQSVKGQQTIQSRLNRSSTYSMANGSQMTNSQSRMMRAPSVQSQTDGMMATIKTSNLEQKSAVNSAVTMPDLTLKEAVEYLSYDEENYQQCGATFIQHVTFKEERAKQEVHQLAGIPALVTLLRSPNPGVSQAAAGALRNLVFKHQDNKLEVQHCGGIGKSLQLLKETDSTETQKQVTGLLWNLSSADELKGELINTALPVLNENVVAPYTCWSDDSATNNIHPEVFYNATGCLRNLSCTKLQDRKTMRRCPHLIDSLMIYLQSCVAEDNPDDKSVENCACILHNLTYKLEEEEPEYFAKFDPFKNGQAEGKKSPTIGCFSPKSGKVQKKFSFNVPEENEPAGIKRLFHTSAMQTYLSLMGTSQKDATLEACCGALQNLTASKGWGSMALSQTLVQKLGALPHIGPLIKSQKPSLQKTAMSLLSNVSSNTTAKQMLPELTGLISSGPRALGKCDETIASACNTARTLMSTDTEASKKFITDELVSSLADLSENGSFPKGSKAASVLLHSLWDDKNLQAAVKKLGFGKTVFVNENTTAMFKSMQVID